MIHLVFFFSIITFAELEVSRPYHSQIILSDTTPSCDNVRSTTRSLEQWSAQGSPLTCPQPQTSGNRCLVDISSCIPDQARRLHGTYSATMGPNCWNLALQMSGILEHLTYTTPEEMAFYMGPPLCRQLSASESRRPGDVVAIRDRFDGNIEESHGFIWIDNNLSFSKNGTSNHAPYLLQPTETVYEMYGVPTDPNCRGNVSQTNVDCPIFTDVYRCRTMNEYLQEGPTPEQLRQRTDQLRELCAGLSDDAIHGTTSFDSLNLLANEYNDLSMFLEEEMNNLSQLSEREKFILLTIKMRLEGLFAQFTLNNDTLFETPEEPNGYAF